MLISVALCVVYIISGDYLLYVDTQATPLYGINMNYAILLSHQHLPFKTFFTVIQHWLGPSIQDPADAHDCNLSMLSQTW